MLIILFHFFLVSSAAAVALHPPDGCQPTSCKRGGPSVRFPFRLKGLQPDHCGYSISGFNLTCNNDHNTVLELPQSVKLLVKRIDYKNQRIRVNFWKRTFVQGVKTKLLISGLSVSGFFLVMSLSVLLWMHYLRKKEKDAERKIEQFLEDYKALKPSRYSYADIKRITFQFKEKLGQGGYGTVFKGTLSNDVSVAVKVLNNFKGNGEEFINEVGSMGRIHHVNVTRLVSFCADGYNRALVYEYLPNESLEKFIFGDKGVDRPFGWEKLHEIALGIAKGIEYLHQGCEQRILHFDIKPHNILLDENFNPKISDFGLAKLCSKEQSAVSMTAARGTMGYIAPEVLSRNFGSVSYKSDVYSFGMLLLEMVGGRKNIDVKVENVSQVYFPEWVYNRLDKGEELGIRTEDEEHDKIANKLTIVGLWCIQWYPVDRPSMKSVVQMLEGEVENLTVPPNPFASKEEMKAKMPINRELPTISE
ncbi:hypothetical protein V6N13_075237 [Hibiscus sabdariffa]